MVEVGRVIMLTGPTSLLKQGHLKPAAQDCDFESHMQS